MASSSASSASNNHGKNWTEPDSLILIDVYQFGMSLKELMTFLQLRLTQLAGESASISNDGNWNSIVSTHTMDCGEGMDITMRITTDFAR